MPLGAGNSGLLEAAPLTMLGPGISSPLDFVPTSSMGPGTAGEADYIPGSSLGAGWDEPVEFLIEHGIRGPQVEPYDLELDRLVNITSAALAVVTDIDLTTVAATALYTAPQKTYVLGVILRATGASAVTGAPQASVGLNPSTDDIFANESLVNFDTVNALYTFWNNTNTGIILNTSGQLDLSVNTGATATTLVATAYVIGVQL